MASSPVAMPWLAGALGVSAMSIAPATAVLRVMVESLRDLTTPTLWLLEMVLALAIVVLLTFGGAYIGHWLQHMEETGPHDPVNHAQSLTQPWY